MTYATHLVIPDSLSFPSLFSLSPPFSHTFKKIFCQEINFPESILFLYHRAAHPFFNYGTLIYFSKFYGAPELKLLLKVQGKFFKIICWLHRGTASIVLWHTSVLRHTGCVLLVYDRRYNKHSFHISI